MAYLLIRQLSRLLLRLFYCRIDVSGAERIPQSGPLIVAANHHNALVDPMLLLAELPRRLRPLAKVGLFRHPLIGPFLWLVGGIPVRRKTDEGGEDPGRNTALFAAVEDVLKRGGAIAIFPEGTTQPEPRLMTIKTGAARMLLGARRGGGPPVCLLPVGLLFQDPGTFRGGSALVLVGEPIRCDDLDEGDLEDAVRELTSRLGAGLRRLIVEADDRETLRLLRAVEALSREGGEESTAGQVARLQAGVSAYRYWLERDRERIQDLRRRLGSYVVDLENAGLSEQELAQAYPWSGVARYVLSEGGSLLLGLPLAVAGILLHFVPYRLTGLLVGWLDRSEEEEATDKIAAGLVIFPVFWIAEGLLASKLFGAGLLFALVLLPAGFFAIGWKERLDRIRRDTRGFLSYVLKGDLRLRLLEKRRILGAEIAELARGVGVDEREAP
jgi:glycerol-3-phosphate O-acyltransferase/dihydroxyacetone phosphate acyltransferase